MRATDMDSSGTVDAQELADVFARHNIPVSTDDVQVVLQELDSDGNGDVDLQEFLDQMRTAQNRRRVLAKDVIKPIPPSRRRPATMETIRNRRIKAKERMKEVERERETARVKEYERHEAMLRETAKAKAAEEAARMKKAALAVKVKERQLQRVRMSGLFASYGSRLASTVLPPISHKQQRAGGTPRGARQGISRGTPRSVKKLATPMTA